MLNEKLEMILSSNKLHRFVLLKDGMFELLQVCQLSPQVMEFFQTKFSGVTESLVLFSTSYILGTEFQIKKNGMEKSTNETLTTNIKSFSTQNNEG